MLYSPLLVPVRTPAYDEQGRLTRTWQDFLGGIARKAGRSALWRGVYSENLEYAVCDVVRENDKLWIALQANPVDGSAIAPGTDDTVWELVIAGSADGGKDGSSNGIPPGGETGQVLAKASGADFDLKWIDLPKGGGEILMQDGTSHPPIPLETEDGTDWLYEG